MNKLITIESHAGLGVKCLFNKENRLITFDDSEYKYWDI